MVIESEESLSVARLICESLDEAAADDFRARLLASRRLQAGRLRYEAALPRAVRGMFQVRVATLRGGVASSTFRLGEAR